MTVYGVTPDGFIDKPLEVIIDEVHQDLRDSVSPAISKEPTSVSGQVISIFGAHLRQAWEVLQAVDASFDPAAAEDLALARLSALTGTLKEAATKSTVTARVNLNAGVTVPTGSIVSVDGAPSARFVTTADAVNGGGSPANVDVTTEAETAGPVEAPTGTLTVIETPVSGWNSVTNLADAAIGTVDESNEDLRARREVELQFSGSSPLDAISADVAHVEGVTAVRTFHNPTDSIDSDGLPKHSVEVVLSGGDDQDVADGIFAAVAGGIQTFGTTTMTVTDAAGIDHDVSFTRPDEVDIYLDLTLTVDDDDYPLDGDDLVKAAVVAWAQLNQGLGDDVVVSRLYAPVFTVSGVLDLADLDVGLTASPTLEANLSINPRQVAVFDTARITVTHT